MACILVHRRHSTKLASLPLSLPICRYALRTRSSLELAILLIYCWELLLSFWYMYDICIFCLLLAHASLFLRDADILITCDWVMVISGLYMHLVQSLSVIFWGTTSRPVGVAYHLYILCMFLYCFYLWCCWLYPGRSFGWCGLYCYLYVYWRLGLAGSRHWRIYMY